MLNGVSWQATRRMRIEHDKALQGVIVPWLSYRTEQFQQFSDDQSFEKGSRSRHPLSYSPSPYARFRFADGFDEWMAVSGRMWNSDRTMKDSQSPDNAEPDEKGACTPERPHGAAAQTQAYLGALERLWLARSTAARHSSP